MHVPLFALLPYVVLFGYSREGPGQHTSAVRGCPFQRRALNSTPLRRSLTQHLLVQPQLASLSYVQKPREQLHGSWS